MLVVSIIDIVINQIYDPDKAIKIKCGQSILFFNPDKSKAPIPAITQVSQYPGSIGTQLDERIDPDTNKTAVKDKENVTIVLIDGHLISNKKYSKYESNLNRSFLI